MIIFCQLHFILRPHWGLVQPYVRRLLCTLHCVFNSTVYNVLLHNKIFWHVTLYTGIDCKICVYLYRRNAKQMCLNRFHFLPTLMKKHQIEWNSHQYSFLCDTFYLHELLPTDDASPHCRIRILGNLSFSFWFECAFFITATFMPIWIPRFWINPNGNTWI